MAAPGFTALGTALAPGIGTTIGAGLDVASLVAEGVGAGKKYEEEMALEREGLAQSRSQIAFEQERKRREDERQRQFSEALARYMGRA
jgi:hypothetical protein